MQNTTNIALSRLVAQQRALDVTATNIANLNTPGFKAERMVFTDWLLKEPARGTPRGVRPESFTEDIATYRQNDLGSFRHTGNPLDLALGDPAAWFTVQTPRGPKLTRAGHFQLSADSTIVDEEGNALLDSTGQKLQVVPTDTVLTVAGDGTLSSENGRIGKIGVVKVQDPTKPTAEGGRLFAANTPTTAVADDKLLQGVIEDSNVQSISEMDRMMNDLREFQFTSEILQSEADRQNGAIDKIMKKGT